MGKLGPTTFSAFLHYCSSDVWLYEWKCTKFTPAFLKIDRNTHDYDVDNAYNIHVPYGRSDKKW